MKTANTNFTQTVDPRCILCLNNTYNRLFDKFNVDDDKRKLLLSFSDHLVNQGQFVSGPEIQRELNTAMCRIIKISDPFAEEKENSNNIATELYQKWKPKVLSSSDPFDLALRLSIAANVMDYGAYDKFDVNETINTVLSATFAIDHSQQLKEKIKNAKTILYLGDNAGEIVFDKLLIETIMHHDVYYAVKCSPILNDVTIKDAHDVGMDLAADVISNGYDSPSTILGQCSKDFLKLYNSADLIISKGQGNFEGLMNQHDPRIFFLLMAKCDVIAETLDVKKGSFLVLNQVK
jgi:hypothetical protein